MKCIAVIEYMKKVPFLKKEKVWKKDFAEHIVPIVEATNKKIKEIKG